jgi:hypothetical protein
MTRGLLLCAVLAAGCHQKIPAPPPLTQAEADRAAAQLSHLLPDRIDAFTATAATTSWVQFPGPRISVERRYRDKDRELTVEIVTGDAHRELEIILTDQEHAFGSDTPTYWRTVQVKGRRARIAENRDHLTSSETYVWIGSIAGHDVTGRIVVDKAARVGESALLAVALDFDTLAQAGVSNHKTQ